MLCEVCFIITSILAQCVSVPDPVNSLLRGYDGYDGYYVLQAFPSACFPPRPQSATARAPARSQEKGPASHDRPRRAYYSQADSCARDITFGAPLVACESHQQTMRGSPPLPDTVRRVVWMFQMAVEPSSRL